MAQPIPEALNDLVALNVEFSVLICRQCKYALKPTTISRHLGDKHKAAIELRKQVDEYVKEFPFVYDHATIQLPVDKTAPQAIIPVCDGFKCNECTFKTRDRSNIRKHANKEHSKNYPLLVTRLN
jgi:hypothetical protein